jgi:hypothetical protein
MVRVVAHDDALTDVSHGDDDMMGEIDDAAARPTVRGPSPEFVYHFSEDSTIRRFAPQVPASNPGHPPAVWAIDGSRSPLYWFPRDCPRVSVWARSDAEQERLGDLFATEATRVCAAENRSLERMRDARVYRYVFDGAAFTPWAEADGQYLAAEVQYPVSVDPLDDLLALHANADIELRFTPRLGELADKILSSGLPFNFVRIRDART